jgi:hypothetical protein
MAEQPPDQIYKHTHSNDEVFLPELSRHEVVNGLPFGGLLVDRKFVACWVRGPAMVRADASSIFEACTTQDDPETVFLALQGAGFVAGVVGLVSCYFLDCRFQGVSFLGDTATLARLRRGFGVPS